MNNRLATIFNSIMNNNVVVETMRTKFLSAKEEHDKRRVMLEELVIYHTNQILESEEPIILTDPELTLMAQQAMAKYNIASDNVIVMENGVINTFDLVKTVITQCYTEDIADLKVEISDGMANIDVSDVLGKLDDMARTNDLTIYLIDAVQNAEVGVQASITDMRALVTKADGTISEEMDNYVNYIHSSISHAPRNPKGILSWLRNLISGHNTVVQDPASSFASLVSYNKGDYSGVTPLSGLVSSILVVPDINWSSVQKAVGSVANVVTAGFTTLIRGVSMALDFAYRTGKELLIDPRDIYIENSGYFEAFDAPFTQTSLADSYDLRTFIEGKLSGWKGNPQFPSDQIEDPSFVAKFSGVWHFPSQFTDTFLVIPESGYYDDIRAYFFINPGYGGLDLFSPPTSGHLNLPYTYVPAVHGSGLVVPATTMYNAMLGSASPFSDTVGFHGFLKGIPSDDDLEAYASIRQGFMAMQFYWGELLATFGNNTGGMHSSYLNGLTDTWSHQAKTNTFKSCYPYFIAPGVNATVPDGWFNFPIGGDHAAISGDILPQSIIDWNIALYYDWYDVPTQTGRNAITNADFMNLISPSDIGFVNVDVMPILIMSVLLTDNDFKTAFLSNNVFTGTSPEHDAMRALLSIPLVNHRYEMSFKFKVKTTNQHIKNLQNVLLGALAAIAAVVVTIGFFKFKKSIKVNRDIMGGKLRAAQNQLASMDPSDENYATAVKSYKKLLKADKRMSKVASALGVKIPLQNINSGLDFTNMEVPVNLDPVTQLIK